MAEDGKYVGRSGEANPTFSHANANFGYIVMLRVRMFRSLM